MYISKWKAAALLAAGAFIASVLLSFSCGQKRSDDSGELAAIAYLIGIGVLRPSVINRPSTEGDPGNAQALECAKPCEIPVDP